MRRRLVISTIAIVLIVIVALAVPVGLLVYDTAEQQLDARVADQATSIAATVSNAAVNGNTLDVDAIRNSLGNQDGAQIVTADGEVLLDVRLDASTTREVTRFAADGTRVTVETSATAFDGNFRRQLQIFLLLAGSAVVAAAVLAAVQGHRLAQPLERLARRAQAIGEGDFSLGPVDKTGISEIDRIGSSLETSSQRVQLMLANERHFTADATHQLRTGIAGVAMRVELLAMNPDREVSDEASEILPQTDQLNVTIDELLAAARNRSTNERAQFDLVALVNDHVAEWKPRFAAARRYVGVATSDDEAPVFGTKGLAGQVIDILIDNALRHGAGSVAVSVDANGVTVIDQGPGVPPDKLDRIFEGPVDPAARHGRGLSLARRLAQVDGASLVVVGNHPLQIRYALQRRDDPPPASRTNGSDQSDTSDVDA